ncbi:MULTISPECIES: CaiB/BaiF CoA transferase family protein [unclassified Rhodococcus (in: high G+C Gram-positive bacteria)]|uniref:CaiB/BaiF CoA transferase family protein n=1 Tax=unclassified Rhodococcus (in: high G+C Gram-positive bacteria) TaxID=192944 RepID=UPI000A795610|nr:MULTISPECIES: CaiB/BaiF CoA-transferase family protein [unclassified Rhodococcus (in: high G+C Gram-positive bacteria)]
MKYQAPLEGLRVVEFLGLGPAPFGCMMLADLGAEVLTLRRPGSELPALVRNRSTLEVDLKDADTLRLVRKMVEAADVLVEGFRPGVMERLGLGPTDLSAANERLVYARMTGWGQSGPLASTAGHDINYIALSGALHSATRRGGTPMPPANLLGDFGGGALYLVTAILSAVYERDRTGRGTVLDIGILDGTTYLTSMLHEYRSTGRWSDEPGTNRLDTGAPYYDVYPCADGKFVAIGALEDPFFAVLLEVLGLEPELADGRHDPASWPALRERIAAAVLTRTRDEWAELAGPTDACLTPVLGLAEAPEHPQVRDRDILATDGRGGWTPRLPIGYRDDASSAHDLLRSWLAPGDQVGRSITS